MTKPIRFRVPVAPLLAALVLPCLMLCVVVAQDLKGPRVSNTSKIIRLWNSIIPKDKEFAEHMGAVNKLLHDRFDPKIIEADPAAKRREVVGHLKAAREALLSEVDAVNELIEEEDY